MSISIELLAPAKNLSCGITAILHGADAVYIGAPFCSARASAGNSLPDIAALVQFAHQYSAKVYVALNTIIYEHEIAPVQKLLFDLYYIGVDALIIQDFGILEMDVPPIPFHASTQMHTTSVEKVKFLEDVGFSQVVLARELSCEKIAEIASQTSVTLECFVHGALCVSYSGQCYMSQYAASRSGNRGECAQMCRHSYVLSGIPEFEQNQGYYLSLKDFHAGDYLEHLLDAGVRSFKIEGRMKDETYVANTTAFYRARIDEIISKRTEFCKSSQGISIPCFVPDIQKSFSRQFTSYFLGDSHSACANPATPKAMGEFVGEIVSVSGTLWNIATQKKIRAGDGLCFLWNNQLQGTRVNVVEHDSIKVADIIPVPKGTQIWRNYDAAFVRSVESAKTIRTISVQVSFTETESGFSVTMTDDYGNSATEFVVCKKDPARNPEKMRDAIREQLCKTGNTIYKVSSVTIECENVFFIPVSVLNAARRNVSDALSRIRSQNYIRVEHRISPNSVTFPQTQHTDARLNCANSYAHAFFRRHGLESVPLAYEIQQDARVPLMTTKYCIRYQLSACWKYQGYPQKADSLFLHDNTGTYRVDFNCAVCEMNIYPEKK